ncbi:hypothetical protein CR983_00845 [Candidatus Saccharibacteria bacterium]|nr:MAG: hypothetical protein CR983_00845 [Candidatus Saccharibacteria bacterium]
MDKHKQAIITIAQACSSRVRRLRLPSWRQLKRLAIGGVALSSGFLCVQYFLPTHVTLSYATTTSCVDRLVLLPGVLSQTATSTYELSTRGGLSLGAAPLVSTQLCATPIAPPAPGTTQTGLAPFGWPLLISPVTIKTDQPPSVQAAREHAIAITQPLELPLSSADVLHSYHVRIGEHTAPCTAGEQLSCDLAPLKLSQGKHYGYTVERQFAAADEPLAASEGSLDILSAVNPKAASIDDDSTVYDKPRTITIKTDKTLSSADAALTYRDGEDAHEHPVTTSVKDQSIVITTETDLARERDFELTVAEATATNGSTLNQPYQLAFRTSGAPHVTGSTLTPTRVSAATVAIYFDQPVDAKSAAQLIRVNDRPVPVKVNKASVIATLPSLARCQTFTLSVNKGLIGSKNDLKSTATWSQTARTTCGEARVVGRSVRGRPIIAHYFGTPGGRTTLFTGGIHGEEHSGAQTMDAWVDYVESHAHEIPAGKQIVVLPRTNPDGLAANSRFNAHDVNIDRNFPARDWQQKITTSGGTYEKGGGSAAGSEPETRAIMAAVSSAPTVLSISYHAQGSFIGSNNYGSADRYASRYASAVGYRNFSYTAEDVLGYDITGEYEMWLAERGIPAILIELPTRRGNYLDYHRDIMWRLATS